MLKIKENNKLKLDDEVYLVTAVIHQEKTGNREFGLELLDKAMGMYDETTREYIVTKENKKYLLQINSKKIFITEKETGIKKEITEINFSS